MTLIDIFFQHSQFQKIIENQPHLWHQKRWLNLNLVSGHVKKRSLVAKAVIECEMKPVDSCDEEEDERYAPIEISESEDGNKVNDDEVDDNSNVSETSNEEYQKMNDSNEEESEVSYEADDEDENQTDSEEGTHNNGQQEYKFSKEEGSGELSMIGQVKRVWKKPIGGPRWIRIPMKIQMILSFGVIVVVTTLQIQIRTILGKELNIIE